MMIAESTEVKIKTVPLAEVQMVVYDADIEEFTLTERYTGNSDVYGDINHNFDIADETFHLKIFVKKDGESLISNEKFLDNPSGELVYLEAPYGNLELISTPGFENGVAIVEEVIETVNETEIVNETEEESSKIVGKVFSVFGDEGVLSKKRIYYIGGFLFLIVIVGFVVAGIKHKISAGPKEIQVKKLSELQREQKENLDDKKEDIEDYRQEIEDAEKKIAEAQADIKKIRNSEKIKEMRKKIAEDEDELNRLREGRD